MIPPKSSNNPKIAVSEPGSKLGSLLYDAIIVGGGPAGLSAALVLGRCCRKVIVFDSGSPRNISALHMHGYLTRDGIPPAEFLACARAELETYGIEVLRNNVKDAAKLEDRFEVTLDTDRKVCARRLLIATGVSDEVPKIENIEQFYGKTVHHCPYCDAWEHRDRPIAVYGQKGKGVGLALSLKTWTSDVVLCTDGPARIGARDRERLARNEVQIHKQPLEKLDGRNGRLERIVFRGGKVLECEALFFTTAQRQACDLAHEIGCVLNRKGTIDTDRLERTNVPGLYVAGDASKDVQLVIVAAAEGAKAAFAINVSLQQEEHG